MDATIQVRKRGTLTLPAELRKRYKIKSGDTFRLIDLDGIFVLTPMVPTVPELSREIERSEEFIESRRKHSAVESSINALENHGLDRCLDHGLRGFERYVALSVLARNIQILGHLIQQKELKKQKRRKAA